MDSLKMLPITNGHPKEIFVNKDNAKELAVGFTGEDVRPDGNLVITPLKVTDASAIDDIEQGKRGLSLGYELERVADKGIYEGEPYEFRQKNIRYNHLAIVKNARAGDEARIHLDSDDADEYITANDGKDENKSPKQRESKMELIKINLDNGLQYEAQAEVKVALDKAISQVTTFEASLKTAESSR